MALKEHGRTQKGKIRALFLSKKRHINPSPPIWMVVFHFYAENKFSLLYTEHCVAYQTQFCTRICPVCSNSLLGQTK